MLKCLLFDLDGLLVDSEPLQFRSYQHALSRFGVSLDLDADIQCVICPDHFIPKSNDAFLGASLIVESLSELNPQILRTVKASS